MIFRFRLQAFDAVLVAIQTPSICCVIVPSILICQTQCAVPICCFE